MLESCELAMEQRETRRPSLWELLSASINGETTSADERRKDSRIITLSLRLLRFVRFVLASGFRLFTRRDCVGFLRRLFLLFPVLVLARRRRLTFVGDGVGR